MTCHWKDCPHGDDCVHAQRSGAALASIASAIAMATEYQAWIDFYHSGSGDYADFMRSRADEVMFPVDIPFGPDVPTQPYWKAGDK